MRISKQLFQSQYLIDFDVNKNPTSYLIDHGPFLYFSTPGIPLYLPIGSKILTSIENICLREAEQLEFDLVDIPKLIHSELLVLGEDFSSGFLDQFIFLKDRMKKFHLLSTPEPYFIGILKDGLQTYTQLPLKIFFNAQFYRQLREVKGILKTREFKMLAGVWLDERESLPINGINNFGLYIERIAKLFSLDLKNTLNSEIPYQEYFYPHAEGEEQFNAQPAISLSMAYRYGKQKSIKTRYRTKNNDNNHAEFTTFGMGLQRLFFIILDNYRDSLGFNLPSGIRPFDIAIIPSKDTCISKALDLADKLSADYKKLLIDDRKNVCIKSKCNLSDFLGTPVKIVVKENTFSIEKRSNGHESHSFDLERLRSSFFSNA